MPDYVGPSKSYPVLTEQQIRGPTRPPAGDGRPAACSLGAFASLSATSQYLRPVSSAQVGHNPVNTARPYAEEEEGQGEGIGVRGANDNPNACG